MNRILSKLNRPFGRSLLFTPTICLIYFLSELAKLRFHDGLGLGSSGIHSLSGWFVFYLIMTVAAGSLWIVSISGRLVDLCLSRLWIIVFLVPWAIILWTMARGNSHQVLAAMIVALTVQLPLMLLPSRRASAVTPSAHPPSSDPSS